ncbi:Mu transposase C-terminal domain-containing protein [Tistlia consotensis]|uniref:Mu transposase C-terminal domain-containing protein n=1 Tax=Tistlia consotensis TaxID=1321365 RepID=UPI001F329151|nr:Mu transposase C-terminal domain-containing protein [Tistlia consotensis]
MPAPASLPASAEPEKPLAEAAPLADWQRRCLEARAAILDEVDRLAVVSGPKAAIMEVVERAAEGRLRPELQALVPVANARTGKDGKRTLSRPSIYRWRAEAVKGAAALAPREARALLVIPAWAPFLMRLYRAPTKRPLAAVMEDLPGILPEDVPAPSYDQARRFLKRLSVVERERGRLGPNALLSVKGFKRRSTEGLEPLDVVTADGHTFKADVAHPVHGRPFRPEVCAVMDVVTRYVFGWSAGLAESTWVVMDTLRCGVERLGQFALLYTDNGSGFVNQVMTGEASSAAVTGFLGRIGATPTQALPGRAQARGKIERLQGTLWKRSARSLPTYNGRDMDNEARRRIVKLVASDIKETGASRLLMSWKDFLSWAETEVEAYNNRPHRGLPKIRDAATGRLRHMSPAECLADWRAQGWEPMTLPAEATDDLFRPYQVRTAYRGEIKLPWGRYFHRDLVPLGREKVRVGYDIHDGSRVWVRTLDEGRLICVAERDANVIPEQPASKVEHSRQERAEARLRLLRQHAEEVEAERGPGLLEHQPATPFAPMPFAGEIEARQAALVAEMAGERQAATATGFRVPDDPEARFELWCEVDRQIKAGETIGDAEARWHAHYQTHHDWKARMRMAADFGSAFPMTAAG